MNRGLRFATAGLVLGWFLTAAAARATTVPQMSLRDMVRMAPSIVHGTVASSSSHWNDDHSLIVTDVRIRITDVLKGNEVGEVVVTQPGGKVGKLRVDVDGAAAFRPGDEAILFLAPDAKGHQEVVGVFRGRFDVTIDTRSGMKSVRGIDPGDVSQLQAAKPGLAVEAAPSSGVAMGLDDFLGGLREMVQTTKGGK
jgi:hypothetical protein